MNYGLKLGNERNVWYWPIPTQHKHLRVIITNGPLYWWCVCLCLTGWMTPAPLWQWLCWWGAQPAVGLCVEHFDLVAVDLVVGVEGTKSVCSPSKYKHLCPNDGGWVEVPPACRSALWGEDQQIILLHSIRFQWRDRTESKDAESNLHSCITWTAPHKTGFNPKLPQTFFAHHNPGCKASSPHWQRWGFFTSNFR